MANIRDIAKEILDANVPEGKIITSDGANKAEFTRLTGMTHKELVDLWDAGSQRTTCNDFTGWYGRQLRAKVVGSKAPNAYLGGFELENILNGLKMGHAWVKSTEDVRPKYGDICRHAIFGGYHVGVSLDFDGDYWNHVDSGQGQVKVRDIIKRTHGKDPNPTTGKVETYDYKKLIGWIDIEVYYGTSPQTGPVPGWLVGWWKVGWRGRDYYYYFDSKRQAKYISPTPPSDTSNPPTAADDTGKFAVDGASDITILWSGTGTIEKLSPVSTAPESRMEGTWNGKEPLKAEKM
jgi:hypothetical protein